MEPAVSLRTEPQHAAAPRFTRRVELAPLDNRKLAALCGPLDENLRQIQQGLDVRIASCGGVFTLHGMPAKTAQAAALLQKLYHAAQHHSPQQIQLELLEVSHRVFPPPAPVFLDDALPVPMLPPTALPSRQGSPYAATQAARTASPLVLRTPRADFRARTPRQDAYLCAIQQNDITFGIGPAGTGKTYLAVACAVDALECERVERLVLVRPAVEAGEHLGFLPGDLLQKVDPYLRPLYDALYELMGIERVNRAFERNTIEVAPLAFMRGRTLNQAFVILDEAQNTTPEQMKMFLTRIGFGSRAVITGDVTQIDLARHQRSGLIDAQAVLGTVPGIAFHRFHSDDVVRHPLVQKIIDAYDQVDADRQGEMPSSREGQGGRG